MAFGKGRKGKGGKPRGRSLPTGERSTRRQLNQRRKNQARRAASRAQRPLPRPANRSVTPPLILPKARPSREDSLLTRLQSVQSHLARLDRQARLEDVYHQLGRIEEIFTQLPARLDALRAQGYVHSGHLEDRLEDLDEDWDNSVRPNVDRQLREAIFRLDRQMESIRLALSQHVRPNELVLNQAEASLNKAEQTINTVRNSLVSLFQGVMGGLGEMQGQVHQAEWMMEHLRQSPEIKLLEAEGPLLAVEAEWEEDGRDEGPDGILYLTDQRLLFEQKEEIATKKFLFITTESEVIQNLLLEIPVSEIEEVSHEEEGRGFLNLRKDDILAFVFSAQAEMSRARFHIRGHESSAWAAIIKRVQSGDIDRDRAEDYLEEAQEAANLTAALPERCPYCFANVPPQPRGVTNIICEYCGSTVSVTD